MFHLNSQSHKCYKLILEVISHQIMDNMHNHHESIGLFKVGLVGNFGFGGFGCFGFLFVCLFVVHRRAGIKIWLVALKGRLLPILSCFWPCCRYFSSISLFTTTPHMVQRFVYSKELVLPLYFYFCSFPSLIDLLFLSCFLLSFFV